jgi:hypothetical protein
MANLVNRAKNNENNENNENNNEKSRKPENTAFKQQRLKAWQPILTPKTVIPTLFLIGFIFVPLGAVFYTATSNVSELIFDYTDCPAGGPPPENVASWTFNNSTLICTIRFNIAKSFNAPVFIYYRLTNFYQNHRKYVRSFSEAQLRGEAVSAADLAYSCEPLDVDKVTNVIYYPCGLIANSFFSDVIGTPINRSDFSITNLSTGTQITFSSSGISWASDKTKYGISNYDINKISPPPAWVGKTYAGKVLGKYWNETGLLFNPLEDLHFQVWMRTAGFPTFRKLYGKSNLNLEPGDYSIEIRYNFQTHSFQGTKHIVFSTTSWLGGKNNFMGIAYMTTGIISVILGIIFLLINHFHPRKLGDHTFLSWNRNPISSVK